MVTLLQFLVKHYWFFVREVLLLPFFRELRVFPVARPSPFQEFSSLLQYLITQVQKAFFFLTSDTPLYLSFLTSASLANAKKRLSLSLSFYSSNLFDADLISLSGAERKEKKREKRKGAPTAIWRKFDYCSDANLFRVKALIKCKSLEGGPSGRAKGRKKVLD